MKWQQLLIDIYKKLSREFKVVLDGLNLDDLHERPAPDANTIGWLLWHTVRSLDRTIGDVMYGEQLWIKDNWYKKFGKNPDSNETGVGHSFEEVGKFKVPDIQTLVDYHQAVIRVTLRYLNALTEDELDREFEASYNPGTTAPVHRRILGNINDCFQHVGQAAYVRGLLKGQGWLGR
jgi:uncharacterized damage-inducible protein DinB